MPRTDYSKSHACAGALCKCQSIGAKNGGKASGVMKDPRHNKQRATSMELTLAGEYKDAGFPKSRRVPMSGAADTLPGDVNPGELLLVEAKMTRGGNLTIDRNWVRKIRRQSIESGYSGYYAIHTWALSDLEDEREYVKTVLVDEDLWLNVLKQLKDAERELGVS